MHLIYQECRMRITKSLHSCDRRPHRRRTPSKFYCHFNEKFAHLCMFIQRTGSFAARPMPRVLARTHTHTSADATPIDEYFMSLSSWREIHSIGRTTCRQNSAPVSFSNQVASLTRSRSRLGRAKPRLQDVADGYYTHYTVPVFTIIIAKRCYGPI